MDSYTQRIYEHLKAKYPRVGDEIITRAAQRMGYRHRSEGKTTSDTGWTEAPITWAETKEPIRRQTEMFSWAKPNWSNRRAVQEFIKLNGQYGQEDAEELLAVFQRNRYEQEPPTFRYRNI